MIRGSIITIGAAFLAAVIAYVAMFIFDRVIGSVSLDWAFGIVFLAFIGSAIITPIVLVRRRRVTGR